LDFLLLRRLRLLLLRRRLRLRRRALAAFNFFCIDFKLGTTRFSFERIFLTSFLSFLFRVLSLFNLDSDFLTLEVALLSLPRLRRRLRLRRLLRTRLLLLRRRLVRRRGLLLGLRRFRPRRRGRFFFVLRLTRRRLLLLRRRLRRLRFLRRTLLFCLRFRRRARRLANARFNLSFIRCLRLSFLFFRLGRRTRRNAPRFFNREAALTNLLVSPFFFCPFVLCNAFPIFLLVLLNARPRFLRRLPLLPLLLNPLLDFRLNLFFALFNFRVFLLFLRVFFLNFKRILRPNLLMDRLVFLHLALSSFLSIFLSIFCSNFLPFLLVLSTSCLLTLSARSTLRITLFNLDSVLANASAFCLLFAPPFNLLATFLFCTALSLAVNLALIPLSTSALACSFLVFAVVAFFAAFLTCFLTFFTSFFLLAATFTLLSTFRMALSNALTCDRNLLNFRSFCLCPRGVRGASTLVLAMDINTFVFCAFNRFLASFNEHPLWTTFCFASIAFRNLRCDFSNFRVTACSFMMVRCFLSCSFDPDVGFIMIFSEILRMMAFFSLISFSIPFIFANRFSARCFPFGPHAQFRASSITDLVSILRSFSLIFRTPNEGVFTLPFFTRITPFFFPLLPLFPLLPFRPDPCIFHPFLRPTLLIHSFGVISVGMGGIGGINGGGFWTTTGRTEGLPLFRALRCCLCCRLC